MERVRVSGSSMLSEFKVSTPCAAVAIATMPAENQLHQLVDLRTAPRPQFKPMREKNYLGWTRKYVY